MAEKTDIRQKEAACQRACPAGVDVPRYIRYIREGNFPAALSVVRESIPFPAVCAYACFHPCEGQCARRQYDEALNIRLLKRAAVEFGGEVASNLPPAAPFSGHQVAVVGAGPAGLTAAYYLAGQGHQVTVFEKRAEPGGLMRYGIPAYRLPNAIVEREIAAILERGVQIKTNSPVYSPAELLSKGFDAVCVAVGAWDSAKIQLKAAADTEAAPPAEGVSSFHGSVAGQVIDGLAFLAAANTGALNSLDGRTVVVGGGNTAIDAARTALRLGAKSVTLLYRRTRAEMPATAEEAAAAEQEGVKFKFLAAPLKITAQELYCLKMAPPDADGRSQPQPVTGSDFRIPCDQVILAVGQKASAARVGLPENANGTLQVSADSLAVAIPGVYGAGDIVKGPSSLIEGIAQGRLAAAAIDKMLGGDGVIAEKWAALEDVEEGYRGTNAATGNVAAGRRKDTDFAPIGTLRLRALPNPLPERTNTFRLAELGYGRGTAREEAFRCLGCDIHTYKVNVETAWCKDCGYCQEVCGQGVYQQSTSFNGQGYRPVLAAEPDKCVGCLKCLMICPDFAISVE